MTLPEAMEEVLETAYVLQEEGEQRLDRLVPPGDQEKESIFQALTKEGLLEISGNQFRFTTTGEKKATQITRNHRLAEVLLSHVLQVRDSVMTSSACRLEHVLTTEVADSVCTLMGHPPVCPHGRPIPRGECCSRFARELKPLVRPVSDLEIGDTGRVAFISPRSHKALDRLGTLGLVPGNVLRLHQKHPAYVIEIGETTIALEGDLAKDIHVRRG